ncbi:MAG: DCC1-like thiol-disulfide oxidoreductase family protein, partial [Acidobacteriota bacterium]
MSEASIVLFDGVCNMCNWTVQFILRRDRRERFLFAPLQSEKGRELLQRHRLPPDQLDSIVLVEAGRAFTSSSAALRIARGLPGLWPLLYGFIAVPRFIRDAVYDWIARNRYRWFGR